MIDAAQDTKAPVLAYPLGDALYLNVTSACTLACVFCPKIRDDDFTVGGFDLRLARNPSADEVWEAARALGLEGRSEVVFTGFGEPTRRLEVVLELTRRLEAAGVGRIRLDTDGLASLREGRDVPPLLAAAGLDAVSVSLNAPDAATYGAIHPGGGRQRGGTSGDVGAGLPCPRGGPGRALPLAPVRPSGAGRRRTGGGSRRRLIPGIPPSSDVFREST